MLNSDFSLRARPDLFFAGQITGVEGYMESAASGILAGKNALRRLQGKETLTLPPETMIGALSRYVQNGGEGDFQPMGANFGVMPPWFRISGTSVPAMRPFSERSLQTLDEFLKNT